MGKTEAEKYYQPRWLVFALFMWVAGALPSQASVTDCINIASDQLRLACYDRLFKGQAKPSADPMDATISAAEKSIARRESPSPSTGVDVNGRVVQIEKTLHNELLVELDNGQVWQQLSPRLMPINEGDEVIVKKARLGGFILSTSSGGSTRVKRRE